MKNDMVQELTCGNCGAQVSPLEQDCPACGFCAACGRVNGRGEGIPARFKSCKFCSSTGISEANLLATVVVVGLAVLAGIALIAGFYHQLAAADEAQYIAASHLVLSGETPYVDFFYVQMPLLPYVYAAGLALVGESCFAVRLVAGLLALGTAVSIGIALFLVTGRRVLSLGGGALVLLSNMFIQWNGVVRIYAPANFFLTTGFLFLLAGLSARRSTDGRWGVFSAGVCLGAAAAVRSNLSLSVATAFLLILLPGLLRYTTLFPAQLRSRIRRSYAFAYLLGAAIPLTFVGVLALRDFSAFYLHTFKVLAEPFSLDLYLGHWSGITIFMRDPQVIILALGSVAGILAVSTTASNWPANRVNAKIRLSAVLAGAMALSILASYLVIPRDLIHHYLNSLIPLLVFMATLGLHDRSLHTKELVRNAPAVIVGLAIYVNFFFVPQLVSQQTVGHYTPESTLKFESSAPLRRLLSGAPSGWHSSEVAANDVCLNTAPDTRLAVSQPLLWFLSGRDPLPGYELGEQNNLNPDIDLDLTSEELERYHIFDVAALGRRLDGRTIGLTGGSLGGALDEAVEASRRYLRIGPSTGWHYYISRETAADPRRGEGCDGAVPDITIPRSRIDPLSLPSPDQLDRMWGSLYEDRLQIIGDSGVIMAFADPAFAESESTGFETAGAHQFQFNWHIEPSKFDSPFLPEDYRSFQGIVPSVPLGGTDEAAASPNDNYWSPGDRTSDTPFSVGAWVFVESDGAGGIVAKWSNTQEWRLYIREGRYAWFELTDGGPSGDVTVSGPQMSADEWHFILATYNGQGGVNAAEGIRLYYDGEEQEPRSRTTGTEYLAMRNTNDQVTIGEYMGGSRLRAELAGGPLGPFFVPRELSAAEVRQLFNLDLVPLGFEDTLGKTRAIGEASESGKR